MKVRFTHTLSILVAMMLLFVSITPAQAAFISPMNQNDAFTDDPPLPTDDPLATPTVEVNEQSPPPNLNLAPTINIWYGNNQSFGQRGNPQTQINILGNLSGDTVPTISYRLNGGTEVTGVPVAPDLNPRLVSDGDFNIALNTSSLLNGQNTLQINAGATTRTIQFNYNRQIQSIPYLLNWHGASSINSVAQVVDGRWALTSDGPRIETQNSGYDRLIGLGDISWFNYEVTVPITVHSWPLGNGEGGVGIIGNWKGHGGGGVLPDDWWLMGAYGYYSNKIGSEGGLAMYINQAQADRRATGRTVFTMPTGTTYLFKLRVERVSATVGRYSLKAWPRGQAEPAWDTATFSAVYNIEDPADAETSGGILLVAHQADATFGNVAVCPANSSQTYTLNVQTNGQGSVSRSPTKSQYACGEEVRLIATPAQGWKFVGWQGDIPSPSSTLYANVVKNTTLTAVFEFDSSTLDEKVFIPFVRK